MRKRTILTALAAVLVLTASASAKQADLLAIPDVTRDKVICFALYTVQDNVLKMTAQLYPLKEDESKTVRLEIKQQGKWKEIARTEIVNPGWTAPFRVENWTAKRDVKYRVAHGENAFYTGTIKKDPIDKREIVVAAFTGNSIHPSHGGDIPKSDICENVKRIKPDLLFFSGDQVYDHHKHYAAWLKFGRDFGEVIRDIPTVTIPDDHDVGQPNLWAPAAKIEGGGAADGGYIQPVEYVKEAERAQTTHLPDPYDPTPIQRGIGVYYTALNVGGISFAIIEDRKFKTGPDGVVPKMGPRPDHINDPKYDPKTVDVPGAVLLGERQLKFLREWATDWSHDADMKVVLSQTIFANAAHIHGKIGGRLHADMDSNGWPQSGRNRALTEIRKGFALMLAGDQHLGTIIHHGIDDWNDSGWSFCVPSIANLYLRWWSPLTPGKNRAPGAPEYAGEHLDGFANKLNIWAAANPSTERNGGTKLTARAAGFGVVRLDRQTRKITMECWPRNVDVTDPAAKQYLGWPKTVDQEDNYGRKAKAWLPTLEIAKKNQVVQVIEEKTGEIVYTLRINGSTWRPKVFADGLYTIRVGEGDGVKTLKGVKALGADVKKTLKVEL